MAVQAPASVHRRARLARWRFTADQFLAMGEVGILPEDDRAELIDGEIYYVPPPGPLHESSKAVLNRLFVPPLADRVVVWIDSTVRLGEFSVVLPDVTLLRMDAAYYAERHPAPGDILLIVEVADSSLRYDRRKKLPLYARHGIPEVWLASMPERRLEVHRGLDGTAYRDVAVFTDGDVVAPACAPDVRLAVGDILRSRFRPPERKG